MQSFFYHFASFLFVCTLSFSADVLDPSALQSFDANNGGILGSQILQFVGPLSNVERDNMRVPNDSILVRLDRRQSVPYYLLIKNAAPIEQRLLDDAKDGSWNEFDLVTASLVADGIRDGGTLQLYSDKFQQIVKAFAKTVANKSADERTKIIFAQLHKSVLRGQYDSRCSSVSEVLNTGNFNCVSATVLFNAFALECGLDVCGLEMPGHALSRVKYGNGKSEDLETTCPNWYLLKNSERSEATLARVGQRIENNASQQNKLPNRLREVSAVQLIATIYYNHGVDKMHEERFAETIALNAKALQLDANNESVWNHIVAPINNWAIKYAEQRRFSIAARLLEEGRTIDPNYEYFKLNQRHVYCGWLKALAEAKRFQDVEIVFAKAEKQIPNDSFIRETMQTIRLVGGK